MKLRTDHKCTGLTVGPCVRLSPDEVAISDVPSVKEIHRIGGNFLKAPWYGKFSQEDFAEVDKGIFSMREPKVHAARRKLFANAFSKNAIVEWEDVVQEKVNMAMNGIKRDIGATGKANILAWFTYMVSEDGFKCVVPFVDRLTEGSNLVVGSSIPQANDVIATLSFGRSFGSLEKGEVSV